MNGTYLADNQKYGYDSFYDKIIDGKSKRLKLELIEFGYGLDKLCDDPDEEIRAAVSARGYVKPNPTKETGKYSVQNIIL